MTMTTYVVTVNMPGYLPESEPTVCDTLSEAWDLLVSEVQVTLDLLDEEHPGHAEWALPPLSEVPLEHSILIDKQWSWLAHGYVHTISQRKPSNGSRDERTVWSSTEGYMNSTRGEWRCDACLPVRAEVDPEDEVKAALDLPVGEESDWWVSIKRLKDQAIDLTVDTPQHCYLCDTLIVLPLSREGLDYVFLKVYDERTNVPEAILNAWEEVYKSNWPQCETCDERFASQADLDEHKPEHWPLKTWAEAEEAYDEWLDEAYPSVDFGNVVIHPRDMLKTDQVAYDEGIDSWVESQGIDVDILRTL